METDCQKTGVQVILKIPVVDHMEPTSSDGEYSMSKTELLNLYSLFLSYFP